MRNANIVGVVSTAEVAGGSFNGLPVIGHIDYLERMAEERVIQEVIVTDASLSRRRIMEIISAMSSLGVRFHMAQDYEDLIAARVINEVAGIEPTVQHYPLLEPRNRFIKRLVDVMASVLLLTILLPVSAFFGRALLSKVLKVFRGDYSLVGVYPVGSRPPEIGKTGLTGLAEIANPERLPKEAIIELNDYYIRNYSFMLDFDIIVKRLFRSISGF